MYSRNNLFVLLTSMFPEQIVVHISQIRCLFWAGVDRFLHKMTVWRYGRPFVQFSQRVLVFERGLVMMLFWGIRP